jgi:hypothetical protein
MSSEKMPFNKCHNTHYIRTNGFKTNDARTEGITTNDLISNVIGTNVVRANVKLNICGRPHFCLTCVVVGRFKIFVEVPSLLSDCKNADGIIAACCF